jgi:hypothetical protein
VRCELGVLASDTSDVLRRDEEGAWRSREDVSMKGLDARSRVHEPEGDAGGPLSTFLCKKSVLIRPRCTDVMIYRKRAQVGMTASLVAEPRPQDLLATHCAATKSKKLSGRLQMDRSSFGRIKVSIGSLPAGRTAFIHSMMRLRHMTH